MTDSLPAEICNCFAMRKAARHVTQLYDRQLAKFGLTVTQFSILARLRRSGPRTINELAAEMGMDRTTMGRNVRPLERDGLVSIAADPKDGRRRSLSLAEAGLERLRASRDGWKTAQRLFETAYGPARAEELRRTLAGVTLLAFSA